MGKFYDLLGARIGLLEVIDQADTFVKEDKTGKRSRITAVMWLCKCDCGTILTVSANHLLKKIKPTSSCGCILKNSLGSKNHSWTGHGEISGHIFGTIRRGAKFRKLEFSITIEYLWELFLKQNRKCALTGRDLILQKSAFKNHHSYVEKTASLDRIDSTKGYIEGNLQWVHKRVNKLKLDFSVDELYQLCKEIVDYRDKEK